MLQVAVVVDYQNIHLSGRDVFCPNGTAAHECLVHPLHFGLQVVQARKARMAMLAMQGKAEPAPEAELASVRVFRGMPTPRENSTANRRVQAQRAEWTRDRRVEVTYRPLRYHWENGHRVAQEKGVDVLVALEMVKAVESRLYDVVILAAHDTDLEPSLEYVVDTDHYRDGHVKIETAGWRDCKRLKASGTSLWHTFLDGAAFVRSRDRKDYT